MLRLCHPCFNHIEYSTLSELRGVLEHPVHPPEYATDALRSKSRYHALDETGVFGATCRHDIPLKMLSMKQGEKYVKRTLIHVSMPW